MGRFGGDVAQRFARIGHFGTQLSGERAQGADGIGRAAVDGGDELIGPPGQQSREARHLLVERLDRAFADARDPRRHILAALAERGHQVSSLAFDDLAQIVDPRPDRAGDAGSARRPGRIGVRGRSRQRLAHRLNAPRQPFIDALGVAVGRLDQVGQARIDDPRALIRSLGESGQARVKDLRALSRGVDDDGPVRVECGADRGFVQVEHAGDALGVIADLVFQLRPARIEAPAQILHRRDDLVLELIDAGAERPRHLFDPAGQGCIDVAGDRRQRLRQLLRPPLQGFADFRRFGVHALRELATAVAERLGGLERIAGERFGERAAALGERVLDPHEQAFERRRDVPQFRPGALLDGLQMGVE